MLGCLRKLHIRKGLVQTVPQAVVNNNFFDCVKTTFNFERNRLIHVAEFNLWIKFKCESLEINRKLIRHNAFGERPNKTFLDKLL
jgi:hypothetical protein